MEPVVVLPRAAHAALVALRDAVEDDALARKVTQVWFDTSRVGTVLDSYRTELRAAGGTP